MERFKTGKQAICKTKPPGLNITVDKQYKIEWIVGDGLIGVLNDMGYWVNVPIRYFDPVNDMVTA